MTQLFKKATIGMAVVLLMAVAMSLPVGGRRVAVTSAVGACPLSFYVSGSTTWAPFTQAAANQFQADWPGTTMNHSEIGSNNGLLDLDAKGPVPGSAPANTQPNDVGVMSRFPVANGSTFEPGVVGGAGGGSELLGNYWWQAAADAFVIGVNKAWYTANGSFLSGGLTVAQLTIIYNAGASITSLHWDDATLWGGPAPVGAPHELIVPRMRITGGGSRTDFDKSIAVPDANENLTYVALGGDGGSFPRLVEMSDMADAANNPDQITYTSLSQIVSHPNMQVIKINGVIPSVATVNDNTYPLPRQLWIGTHDKGTVSRVGNSTQVRADDYVNYTRSDAGRQLFAAVGFPTIPPANVPPIPDWDVDLNGTTSLGDIGQIVANWGQQTNCKGWIRPDADNNSKVSLGDVGTIAQHWGNDGLICDVAHLCKRDGAQGPQ